ncbi:hypothetical protein Cfor_01947, partial [Coptotermes formosanus]
EHVAQRRGDPDVPWTRWPRPHRRSAHSWRDIEETELQGSAAGSSLGGRVREQAAGSDGSRVAKTRSWCCARGGGCWRPIQRTL